MLIAVQKPATAGIDAAELVTCPHCLNGLNVSPRPNGPELCLFCGGTAQTLLHVRCHCGRQVNLQQELSPGVFYCGREKCGLAMLKAEGAKK